MYAIILKVKVSNWVVLDTGEEKTMELYAVWSQFDVDETIDTKVKIVLSGNAFRRALYFQKNNAKYLYVNVTYIGAVSPKFQSPFGESLIMTGRDLDF